MATDEGKADVQILPAAPGSVTTLNGTSVTAFPMAAQQQPASGSIPGGTGAPWGPAWPMVMPQPSVIVVTVESKKEGGKPDEKKGSEVFKRV